MRTLAATVTMLPSALSVSAGKAPSVEKCGNPSLVNDNPVSADKAPSAEHCGTSNPLTDNPESAGKGTPLMDLCDLDN